MTMKWGYSMNAWNTEENSIRRDRIERNLKVVSVCDYEGVVFTAASGRWSPLGRPENLDFVYGSAEGFKLFLHDCGIKELVGWYYDPSGMMGEESVVGVDTTAPGAFEAICATARVFLEYQKSLGSRYFIVRPMSAYWKVAPVTGEKIEAAARCMNALGALAAEYGVKLVLRPDWLCGINNAESISALMAATDPALVGLCINTGELCVAGVDVLALYEKLAERVDILELEDCRTTDTLEEYKGYMAEMVLAGGGKNEVERWFWEPGWKEGLVDFPALVRAAKARGFDGWMIVETSQAPDPAESVLFSNWYVKNVLKKI